MANIRGSLRTFALNPQLIAEYETYINTVDESIRANSQKILEKSLSNLYGKSAGSVGGRGISVITNNERLIPDYIASGKSFVDEILSSSVFKAENASRLNIEAKVKQSDRGIMGPKGVYEPTTSTTTIGSSVLASVLPEFNSKTRETLKGLTDSQMGDIFKHLAGSGGERMFNFLAKNAPAFHEKAYNKAKNLVIFYKNSTSVNAYEFHFPRSQFTAGIFGATTYASKATESATIYYYLNNSFEKAMINKLNEAIVTSSAKGFRTATFKYGNTQNLSNKQRFATVNIKNSSVVDIEWDHTNSIPTAAFKVPLKRKRNAQVDKPISSIVDITQLVRGRVRLRMRRGTGKPYPTIIHERSGTFRSSIEAYANLKTKTINYFYTPYYDSLEAYGYEITDLVEGSIRAIARERFNQQFNLRRKVN